MLQVFISQLHHIVIFNLTPSHLSSFYYILYLNDFTAKHDVYKVTAIVDTRFKSAQLH